MNCRLPQTPRSPAAAASHYFDDVFTRQRRASLSRTRRNSLARSITRTRSIGARSDWTNGGAMSGAPSQAGDDDDEDQDVGEDGVRRQPQRQWSIYKEDPADAPRQDKDDPINVLFALEPEYLQTFEKAFYGE